MVIYATWESSTDREDFDLLQTVHDKGDPFSKLLE